MATKKEVKELQDEIIMLSKKNSVLSENLIDNENTIRNLKSYNAFLKSSKAFLEDECDTLTRKSNCYEQNCIALMNAIVVLGKHEMNRILNDVWHTCQPRQAQAASLNNKNTQSNLTEKGNYDQEIQS